MMVIDNKFEIGDFVYLTTDPDQLKRVVTAIKYCKGGELVYGVQCGTVESFHYEFELSTEKDLTLAS